ncbi:twisted gastrulation protein homolog 1-A [Copidosoma floridanum]|uniref:twisted gastrulation protein homolog 1-A n=1 Tax=Copidosoma floridanum TaxID=29053 RepID=UPI0006C9D155|nr:twisted gastrulation protein homolog 1-A [Copidosoma floridanum]
MSPRMANDVAALASSPVSLLGLTVLLLSSFNWSYACNEAICASVVSKCMLTQSCKCDLVSCTCCKDCFSCLSYLYDECCSCVDLCPKPNVTDNRLSKKSHVEEFGEPIPGLFQALTAEPDPHERWHTFTYPVDFNITLFSPKPDKEIKYRMMTENDETQLNHPLKPNVVTFNCSVAYISTCTSWGQCKKSCQSMGASSYRWFHDGCCECVGDTCINYGINESRCQKCPVDKEEELKEQFDDYGQDDDYLGNDEVD